METVSLVYTHDKKKTKSSYCLVGVVPETHVNLLFAELLLVGYSYDEFSVENIEFGDYDTNGLL